MLVFPDAEFNGSGIPPGAFVNQADVRGREEGTLHFGQFQGKLFKLIIPRLLVHSFELVPQIEVVDHPAVLHPTRLLVTHFVFREVGGEELLPNDVRDRVEALEVEAGVELLALFGDCELVRSAIEVVPPYRIINRRSNRLILLGYSIALMSFIVFTMPMLVGSISIILPKLFSNKIIDLIGNCKYTQIKKMKISGNLKKIIISQSRGFNLQTKILENESYAKPTRKHKPAALGDAKPGVFDPIGATAEPRRV